MNEIQIKFYLEKLLENYFPDNLNTNLNNCFLNNVLKKISYCFKNINRKYYNGDINKFDILNSDHLCILFYFCSVEAFNQKKINLAKKFFLLNKIINGIDLFYEVRLPKILLFSHPHSTIVGRARYSNYVMFSQNVTIGRKGSYYPSFGTGVVFYSGSKVIGKCHIGKNVIFAPGSIVIDTNVPDDSIVIGQYPNIVLKKNKFNLIKDFFRSKKKLIL